MTAMHAAGALVVLGLLAYLLFALVRPEKLT
jgi:K+-transporting ATPase KdpF subunit